MTTMVATTLTTYNGKPLRSGQRFEVDDERHVHTLVLSQKAKLATDETEVKSGRTYRRRDMQVEK